MGAIPWREMQGEVEVLLVTSRDTGRWVVPKGNPIPGLSAWEAAAQESWEEAGVRGTVGRHAIGRFRYVKRRRRGDRDLTVAVFPLAVTEEAADWPERGQRNRQWFTPADAARLVAEPGLADLLAGFSPTGTSPKCNMAVEGPRTPSGRVPMLAWFRALLPKQGRFFDQFEEHAAILVQGAAELAQLLDAEGEVAHHVAEIDRLERAADTVTRDVLQDVRRVFITPFDRSAIAGLIGVMDDAIDQMNSAAKAIRLYGYGDFPAEMRELGLLVVEAAQVTVQTVPLLRSVNTNAGKLNELTGRLVDLEDRSDELYDRGLADLFLRHGGLRAENAMGFVIGREIFGNLEKVMDRFEDVGDEIQGLVIDHA